MLVSSSSKSVRFVNKFSSWIWLKVCVVVVLLAALQNSNLLLALSTPSDEPLFENEAINLVPAAFKGRFRPLDVYARLWLYDWYHHEQIKPAHRAAFHSSDGSALDFLWKLHFFGHAPWDDAPLFWIHNAELKSVLGLDTTQYNFSYHQLHRAIYEDREANLRLMKPIIAYYFLKSYRDPTNRSMSAKQELKMLSPHLWVMLEGNEIVVATAPKNPPWHFLEPGFVVAEEGRQQDEWAGKALAEDALNLLSLLHQFAGFEGSASTNGDSLFKVLPSKRGKGEWLPLRELKASSVGNFTLYPDELFAGIRNTYLALEKAVGDSDSDGIQQLSFLLASQLTEGYVALAEKPYIMASGKTIAYPSLFQLQTESWYYRFPLTVLALIAYSIAFALLVLGLWNSSWRKWGIAMLCAAFLMHTFILGIRCYILQRPPVSNMFETVVYVPWIAVLAGFILFGFLRNQIPLIGSSLVAMMLLFLLQATPLNNSLDNVQAVLDSQYWLIIHVLLVVGSYGAFALSGVLGHIYLIALAITRKETAAMRNISRSLLQAMYAGVAMLIPGTILGGVWAAESWGRFWDWDPKESWAFISICTYLIGIHAYTFHYIRSFGLAVGAICGLIVISFTWYGVNYILGTGLHSYGFGSGGEHYYYLFLIAEIIFLGFMWSLNRKIAYISIPDRK